MPPRRKKTGNPFRGVVDMVSEMNRISDHMAGTATGAAQQQAPAGHPHAWSPTTDILAQGEDLVIRCELAGVATEDVEVSYSRGTLSIDGARHQENTDNTAFYVQERAYGQFRRDITLPEGVQEKDIEAEFSEGVLLVVVKKSAAASGPAQITVRS